MTNFVELFEIMESWGMLDVMLPFLLIFTVVFAVLQKAKIFGQEESKRYNVVIAFVLAMVVVIPHIMGTYPPRQDIVVLINQSLPNVALVLIAIIMVLLLSGVFGYKTDTNKTGWLIIPAFLVVIYIFGASAGWWENFSWFNIDSDTQAVILVLLAFCIIIWIITSDNILKGVKPIQGLFGKTE